MEQELRNKMIAKARENGSKHGKTAELDFGAGAEWMHEQLVKNCFIPNVSQQRELLEAFVKQIKEDNELTEEITFQDINKCISSNCG